MFLLVFGTFLLCTLASHWHLFAMRSCCFLKLPCYELLLIFSTSLLCIHVALQCLFIVSFCCSSMAPCCALLVLFNASLLCTLATFSHLIMCYYYFSMPPYCVLLVYFHASLLCIPNVIQCLVVCSWCSLAFSCFLSPPCYSFILLFGIFLFRILVAIWFLFKLIFPHFFYVGVEDEFFVIFPSTTNLKGGFIFKSMFFQKKSFFFLFFSLYVLLLYFFFPFFFGKVGFHFILLEKIVLNIFLFIFCNY